MARLSRADMEAVLAFGAEVGDAASAPQRADMTILEKISCMIQFEVGDYSQHGSSPLPIQATDFPSMPHGTAWAPTEHEWDVIEAEHPFCRYAERSHDPFFSARRLSDVVDVRAFRATEIYGLLDYAIRPHAIQMRTPGSAGTEWQLNLARSGRDFSTRDCLMLDALRAALIGYESQRALSGLVSELRSLPRASSAGNVLSRRENEVLDLVAHGATNAAIAERLWISAATVKKHLEHIYTKLDVGSRTAALAQTGRASAASDGREA